LEPVGPAITLQQASAWDLRASRTVRPLHIPWTSLTGSWRDFGGPSAWIETHEGSRMLEGKQDLMVLMTSHSLPFLSPLLRLGCLGVPTLKACMSERTRCNWRSTRPTRARPDPFQTIKSERIQRSGKKRFSLLGPRLSSVRDPLPPLPCVRWSSLRNYNVIT